jgi:hypothetical protein
MRITVSRILAIALALTLATAAGAFAGALHGKTYEGGAPAWGVNSEGHRVRTHAGGNIVLRVAGSGRSMTVRFSSSAPVLYCNTRQRLHVQSSRPASISGGGTFKAAVAQRFTAGPGPPSIVQVISGRFSGRTVRGTIATHAAECGGTSSFYASAR